MKKRSIWGIFIALLILGVLIAAYAYAEHTHVYEQGFVWRYNSTQHWKEYYDKCKCGANNPNPGVVLVPSPFGDHTPSAPKYDKNLKKDVITCSVCKYRMKTQTHQHRYKKTNEKVNEAHRINSAQHVAYLTLTYKCECGDSYTTKTSRTESHNPLHGTCSRCKTTN